MHKRFRATGAGGMNVPSMSTLLTPTSPRSPRSARHRRTPPLTAHSTGSTHDLVTNRRYAGSACSRRRRRRSTRSQHAHRRSPNATVSIWAPCRRRQDNNPSGADHGAVADHDVGGERARNEALSCGDSKRARSAVSVLTQPRATAACAELVGHALPVQRDRSLILLDRDGPAVMTGGGARTPLAPRRS